MSREATKPGFYVWDNRDNGGWGLEEMYSGKKNLECLWVFFSGREAWVVKVIMGGFRWSWGRKHGRVHVSSAQFKSLRWLMSMLAQWNLSSELDIWQNEWAAGAVWSLLVAYSKLRKRASNWTMGFETAENAQNLETLRLKNKNASLGEK